MSSGVVGSPPAPLWCWELIRRALGPPPYPTLAACGGRGMQRRGFELPDNCFGSLPPGCAVLVAVCSGESLEPSASIEAKTFGSSTPALTSVSCEDGHWDAHTWRALPASLRGIGGRDRASPPLPLRQDHRVACDSKRRCGSLAACCLEPLQASVHSCCHAQHPGACSEVFATVAGVSSGMSLELLALRREPVGPV